MEKTVPGKFPNSIHPVPSYVYEACDQVYVHYNLTLMYNLTHPIDKSLQFEYFAALPMLFGRGGSVGLGHESRGLRLGGTQC